MGEAGSGQGTVEGGKWKVEIQNPEPWAFGVLISTFRFPYPLPMPYAVKEFQSTPNPNAVKCVLDRVIRAQERAPASFRSAADARSDPLASALFAVPGVVNLLINEDWITVNKNPKADWKTVKAGVSRVLAGME